MSLDRVDLVRTDDGWLASSHPTVCAVLESDQLGVVEAPPGADVGTIAWLRSAVSRFSNGTEHARRRATVTDLIDGLEPEALRRDAARRARTDRNYRHVVAATLAAALGAVDPEGVADAVLDCAGAYFPGADQAAGKRADDATARLVDRLGDGDLEVVVARIAVLVQACDATAALIEAELAASDVPPVRVIRRVALCDTTVLGARIARGEAVVCDVERADRETAEPLTFGHGPRSCPGVAQALALAGGVVDAVRRG